MNMQPLKYLLKHSQCSFQCLIKAKHEMVPWKTTAHVETRKNTGIGKSDAPWSNGIKNLCSREVLLYPKISSYSLDWEHKRKREPIFKRHSTKELDLLKKFYCNLSYNNFVLLLSFIFLIFLLRNLAFWENLVSVDFKLVTLQKRWINTTSGQIGFCNTSDPLRNLTRGYFWQNN